MKACDDILDLLLPDAAQEERERARRLAAALRALLNAARGERAAEAAGASVERAAAELEELGRRRREECLTALLHRHLVQHFGAGRLCPWGEPALSLDDAWRGLIDEPSAPALPAPGESALAVARRLYDELARVPGALDGGRPAAVWGARLRRAERGPVEGEAASRALASADGFAARRAAVADVAACLFDRGRVREASAWLDSELALVSADEELAWLFAWSKLLLGDVEGARAAVRGLPPYAGLLPSPLAELRARRPEWVALLPGREPAAETPWPAVRCERGELGASVLAVFALGAAAETFAVHAEVAPGLRDELDAWLAAKDGAGVDPAAPEHALIASAAPVLRHREMRDGRDAAPLRGALDRASLAQALVPICFGHGAAEGEVAGWIALEFAHHLLPSRARLEALAEAWRGRVLEAAWERRGAVSEEKPARPDAEAEVLDPEDPRARALSALVARLGMKLVMRRWWGYEVENETPRLIATGGGALADWRAQPGRGRALARAVSTGGRIRFDSPDERLSLHARSGSGIVLATRSGRGIEALLAVESTRARDFQTLDQERLAAMMDGFLDDWCGARFSAWHRQAFGEEVLVEPRLGFPLPPSEILAAGRAHMDAAVVGPEGVGKEVLARWLHREGAGADARLRRVTAGEGDPARLAPRGEATWILVGLERADAAWQAGFVAAFERLSGAVPRLILLCEEAPEDAARAGRVHRALAERVGKLVLTLPPLAERRNAIPALAELFARRIARHEALAPPALTEAAEALLWRQSWPGHLRQLEALMARLALLHPASEVGPDEVRGAAQRIGLRLVTKIPSRHPSRRDLLAALEWTRCASGAPNKTRAAFYLGWDPDTLVARLRDAHLDPSEPEP